MTAARHFERFFFKDANVRLACVRGDLIRTEIVKQRELLDAYIERHPNFLTSFVPISLRPGAPECARRMAAAAAAVGVGPMAAVAGAMAQLAAEAALAGGAPEVIVENGGDLFMVCTRPLSLGLYAGESALGGKLALRITPAMTPLAICSSSGRMGHSTSLGCCDLATVVSTDAALADAAATLAANLVRQPADIAGALATVSAIPGIRGLLIAQADRVGMAGDFPELVPNLDPDLRIKITRDPSCGTS